MGNSDSAGTAGPTIITSANRTLAFGVGDSFSSNSGGNFTGSMYIVGGSVGIGTSSPYAGTNVTSLDINATAYPVLALSVASSYVGGMTGYSNHIAVSAKTGNYITLEPNDTEAVRITGGGNVGIGTNSPNARLEVSASSGTDLALLSYGNIRAGGIGSSGGEFIASGKFGNSNVMRMYHDDSNGYIQVDNIVYAGHLILQPTSNVGIGTTSPVYKLQVSGSIAIENQGTTTIESTTFAGSLTTNTNIAFVPTGSFKAAFFDYYVASGSVNMRAGTVMAVHNNSTSRYTDTSTADIGTTAAVDFSTSVVAGSLVLTANIASGTWEIKTAYRAL
jgi:hypothetical protein